MKRSDYMRGFLEAEYLFSLGKSPDEIMAKLSSEFAIIQFGGEDVKVYYFDSVMFGVGVKDYLEMQRTKDD